MKIILNDLLTQKGLSKYWLAKKTGMTANAIGNLCNNKTDSIKFDTLQKICDVLECEIADVLKLD